MKGNIAIIPARGGSKRIENKSVIEFFGKPLILWTIESALDSRLFDRVVVSTDSKEIARVSKLYGAEVPFLRNNFVDDYSPVSMATLFTLEKCESFYNQRFENVVQLLPNCPLRNSQNLIDQFDYYLNQNESRSVLSAVRYGMFNPFWAHRYQKDHGFKPVFSSFNNEGRSQDYDVLLCPTGSTWISSVSRFKDYKTFYSDKYKFFELDFVSAVDIDTYEDLDFAKACYLFREMSKI
jgi:N-acylneuraminate cytidylyltransferase